MKFIFIDFVIFAFILHVSTPIILRIWCTRNKDSINNISRVLGNSLLQIFWNCLFSFLEIAFFHFQNGNLKHFPKIKSVSFFLEMLILIIITYKIILQITSLIISRHVVTKTNSSIPASRIWISTHIVVWFSIVQMLVVGSQYLWSEQYMFLYEHVPKCYSPLQTPSKHNYRTVSILRIKLRLTSNNYASRLPRYNWWCLEETWVIVDVQYGPLTGCGVEF